jgi:hypothetical protein
VPYIPTRRFNRAGKSQIPIFNAQNVTIENLGHLDFSSIDERIISSRS